ncbi:uncharacterized protein LOC62_01G000250 [Vanrija pseudolonga]|uniref:NADH dehydrogenase [ubiquinone] 1 beta subcomplex subunit 11, mitochondrial n=1 Tax=Vanrija pseudolonga TaxID=143232 RepID=A0AAF0Y2Y6_9TREE|nr:hypothetical protein LOC62_01G000250 [Vanrija pseudolonga]
MLRQPATTALRAAARATARPAALAPGRFGSHGPSYNEPSGYVYGEVPPTVGKRQREGWELITYLGLGGALVFAGVVIAYKPDTSIQTWALAEAKRRMDERGEKYQYVPSAGYAADAVAATEKTLK